MCGSTWGSLYGSDNAFTSVGTSTTSYGCTCTCPNGTPTTSSGSGATLCDEATVDCSACNSGYKISATAAAGSAQTCSVNTCTATQVTNSDKATANSITGRL